METGNNFVPPFNFWGQLLFNLRIWCVLERCDLSDYSVTHKQFYIDNAFYSFFPFVSLHDNAKLTVTWAHFISLNTSHWSALLSTGLLLWPKTVSLFVVIIFLRFSARTANWHLPFLVWTVLAKHLLSTLLKEVCFSFTWYKLKSLYIVVFVAFIVTFVFLFDKKLHINSYVL